MQLAREELESSDHPWGYRQRVAWSSRSFAFLPALLGVIGNGAGMFMAHDAAMGRVPFWSNIGVWVGLGHLLFCAIVSACMYWGRWLWTAPQMAVFGLSMFSVAYWWNISSLIGVCLYGSADVIVRTGAMLATLAWYGWWGCDVAGKCRQIWESEDWRQRIWVEYDKAVVYRQFDAKAAFDAFGLRFYPGNGAMVSAAAVMFPLVWWRQEFSALFGGVPIVHVISILVAPVIGVLMITSLTVAIVMMMIYPAKIVAQTGKPVLVDMITPAGRGKEPGLARRAEVITKRGAGTRRHKAAEVPVKIEWSFMLLLAYAAGFTLYSIVDYANVPDPKKGGATFMAVLYPALAVALAQLSKYSSIARFFVFRPNDWNQRTKAQISTAVRRVTLYCAALAVLFFVLR